ncbi:hypothetical protein B0H13DRAFT_1871034 [Mycena leptocephala]|nr:hypothetical protein B0H13DRAFT_1871034 [Mycena leptocephala]
MAPKSEGGFEIIFPKFQTHGLRDTILNVMQSPIKCLIDELNTYEDDYIQRDAPASIFANFHRNPSKSNSTSPDKDKCTRFITTLLAKGHFRLRAQSYDNVYGNLFHGENITSGTIQRSLNSCLKLYGNPSTRQLEVLRGRRGVKMAVLGNTPHPNIGPPTTSPATSLSLESSSHAILPLDVYHELTARFMMRSGQLAKVHVHMLKPYLSVLTLHIVSPTRRPGGRRYRCFVVVETSDWAGKKREARPRAVCGWWLRKKEIPAPPFREPST